VEPPPPQRQEGRRVLRPYAKELDATKRQAIGKELLEYMVDNVYWNNVSGSPFYMVAQPWVKGYTYNAEFEVDWETVWLDK
jgi:ABC-type transport system substrate-binding protein